MKIKILSILYILLAVNVVFSQQLSPIEKMLNKMDSINTISCIIKSTERLSDGIAVVEQKVVSSSNPLRCKIEFIHPKKGAKVIYDESVSTDELHYEPAGFPYFNLKLDPLGSLARKNNHYTVREVGFSYFSNIIKHEIKNKSIQFETKKVIMNGKEHYLVHAKYTDFTTIPYKMKKGETIREIALKKRLSEYLILYLNDNLDSYDDWSDDEIQLPNHYCSEINIYIDPTIWLPSSIQISDEEGVFERYDYSNMKTNIKIEPKTFHIN